MYHNKEILVNSSNQNPNDFQVKLPYNIDIHPNTEVAITKGKFELSDRNVIDDSNNAIVLMIGNGVNTVEGVGAGSEANNLLNPQLIKLKKGSWKTFAEATFTAGDAAGVGFGDKNILTNLVDSLNEQNIFYMWQFAGDWNTNSTPRIFSYIPPHFSGGPAIHNAGFGGSPTIVQTAINPGVAPSFATVSTGIAPDESIVITRENIMWPYHYAVKNNAADNPQKWYEVTLKANPGGQLFCLNGGMCFEHQYTYRNNNSYGYNPAQDFLRIPMFEGRPDFGNTNEILPTAPLSWRVDFGTLNIIFDVRKINRDGSVGDIITSIDSGTTFDGSVDRVIELRPIFAIAANATTFIVEFYVGGVLAGSHDFTGQREYFNAPMRFFFTNDSQMDMEIISVGKLLTTFNDAGNSIGTADQGQAGAAFSNSVVSIYNEELPIGTQVEMGPAGSMVMTIVTEFNNFLKQCNAKQTLIGPDPDNNADGCYVVVGTSTANAGAIGIRVNGTDAGRQIEFHINLENLPIENCSSFGVKGMSSRRIFSHYDVVKDDETFGSLSPHNLTYHKLQNKQVFMLDHLKVRVTDTNGAICNQLVGSLTFNLHLKSNEHAMLQAMTGAINNMAQKLETIEEFEEVDEMARNVF